jgi:putative ABC transport system substrate-binding protein
LHELVPHLGKLAVLAHPTNAAVPPARADIADAARRFNITVVVHAEVTRAEDFPTAFAVIRNARPDGLVVFAEPLIATHHAEVIDFAATAGLPTIYDNGGMASHGGLIAYSPDYLEHYALAAVYVDKILKGAKPADLPVQQPTRVELVVNMKTAKALGITIPQSLLLRADEVIE